MKRVTENNPIKELLSNKILLITNRKSRVATAINNRNVLKNVLLVFLAIFIYSCGEDEIDEPNTKPPLFAKLLPLDLSKSTSSVVVFNDEINNTQIVLAGNAKDLFIVSFNRELNSTLLEFSAISDQLPVIMEDNEGNKWDVFGNAVEGPRIGQRLNPTQSLLGYWFSFATFYPGIEIYTQILNKGEFEGEKIIGSNDWLVPHDEVRSGGVGKDGIPALSNPEFDNATDVDYLDNEELVVGFSTGINQKSYPHSLLDWHEIVNDELLESNYSIIYCPLTGTATAWNRNINDTETTFGVSGLLYNTNIVPYDRATGSNWSQLFNASIFGEQVGTKPENFMVLETKWETWKMMYPESKVANFNTGYGRSYGYYPYGNYRTDESLIFPVKYLDKRLEAKERVYTVVVDGNARVYRFDNFIGE